MRHQELPSSLPQWARWTQANNNSLGVHKARHLAHQALSLVATRRLHSGERARLQVKGIQALTSSDRMGELEPWIDENFVRSVWFGMGYQVNVKMIRDKFSG